MPNDIPINPDADSVKQDVITLKWGNLKAWSIKSDEAIAVWNDHPTKTMSMSAMTRQSKAEAEWLIRLIDASNCETIYLSWDAKDVTKQEAIDYVRKSNGLDAEAQSND